MSDMKDMLTGLVFGTILCSADKMGINPMLLGRQSAKILGPMIGALTHQFIGKDPPTTMEELLKEFETLGKSTGILDKEFELNYSGNKISLKINECPWLEMAKYGKSMRYKACPLCGVTIILMGAIEAMGFSQVVSIEVDNSDTVCKLRMAIEQK